MNRFATVGLICLVYATSAFSAEVVVVNNTERDQEFNVRHTEKSQPVGVTLGTGELRTISVGKASELRVSLNGQVSRFTLEPYAVYVFAVDQAGKHSFQGVQLAGVLPKPDDIPEEPLAAKPLTIPVFLYADDTEKRAKPIWEKVLRGRFDAAATVLAQQCGVKFEFAGTGEWKSEPIGKDFGNQFVEFTKAVPAKPGELHIGYLGRAVKDTTAGLTKAPFTSHILMREEFPKTEGERVEMLAHQLGQYLGAVRTADPISVMRLKLPDGRATQTKYRMQFDPLNILAIRIWASEVQAGQPRELEKLRPAAKDRLFALYKTQAAIHAQSKSDDTQAKEYAFALDLSGDKEPEKPAVGVVPEAESKLTPAQRAIRMVVRGLVTYAEANAKLPADKKKTGDALTGEYFRVAADIAIGMDEPVRATAFLVGLGITLDDSPLLRTNFFTRGTCAAIESEEEVKQRVAVLNSPSIRNRRDLCQHYVVSMALTALRGPAAAEVAGITKELLDMKGTSGFSFIDLAADFAGVALAKKVIATPKVLDRYRSGFQLDHHVPDLKGLREGMNEKQFTDDFRSTDDPKFKATVVEIKDRIAKLEAFK